MAKRKLHGAALAAYNRKRGIGGGALARRGTRTIVKTRTRTVKVRARRRRGGGGGGGGAVRTLRGQFRDLIGAAGYGFLTGDHNKMPAVTSMVAKVPTVAAIGKPASHGLLLHFIAGQTSGMLRTAAGHLSHAALMHAAHNLGKTGGDLQAAASLSGDDYGYGDIGDDDFDDVGDDADVVDE